MPDKKLLIAQKDINKTIMKLAHMQSLAYDSDSVVKESVATISPDHVLMLPVMVAIGIIDDEKELPGYIEKLNGLDLYKNCDKISLPEMKKCVEYAKDEMMKEESAIRDLVKSYEIKIISEQGKRSDAIFEKCKNFGLDGIVAFEKVGQNYESTGVVVKSTVNEELAFTKPFDYSPKQKYTYKDGCEPIANCMSTDIEFSNLDSRLQDIAKGGKLMKSGAFLMQPYKTQTTNEKLQNVIEAKVIIPVGNSDWRIDSTNSDRFPDIIIDKNPKIEVKDAEVLHSELGIYTALKGINIALNDEETMLVDRVDLKTVTEGYFDKHGTGMKQVQEMSISMGIDSSSQIYERPGIRIFIVGDLRVLYPGTGVAIKFGGMDENLLKSLEGVDEYVSDKPLEVTLRAKEGGYRSPILVDRYMANNEIVKRFVADIDTTKGPVEREATAIEIARARARAEEGDKVLPKPFIDEFEKLFGSFSQSKIIYELGKGNEKIAQVTIADNEFEIIDYDEGFTLKTDHIGRFKFSFADKHTIRHSDVVNMVLGQIIEKCEDVYEKCEKIPIKPSSKTSGIKAQAVIGTTDQPRSQLEY